MSSYRLIAPLLAVALGGFVVACADENSATDLHTAGPPKVQQVRLVEDYQTASGGTSNRIVFAFGTAPPNSNATSDDEHPVTSAKAINQKLRVIMDQLLEGNTLEEIACVAPTGPDGPWSTVPEGATPDDVAACSVALDVLPASCKGTNRQICICQMAAGCPVGSSTVPMGQSVGVLDTNMDGAADDNRFIEGAVHIMCGSIDVPLKVQALSPGDIHSYWNPSGFQEVPAKGGFDALGPAIVLVPDVAPGTLPTDPVQVVQVLPTNTTCGLTFDPSVVNKRHEKVCIPAGGDPNVNCTPPDTSAFTFQVEALQLSPNGFTDMQQVGPMDSLNFFGNAPLDRATLSNITITQGATPFTDYTVIANPAPGDVAVSMFITPGAAGWPAASTFTLTFPTTIHDAYAQPLPAPAVYHFSTP